VLRLRDGETQVLAGLINDEDRRSATQVPGLWRLPVIGRLFTSHNDTANKTEIVLLITPRVVRNIERPGAVVESFNSGSEMEVGGAGAAPLPPGAPTPADAAPPAQPAPAPQPKPAPPAGGQSPSLLPPTRP